MTFTRVAIYDAPTDNTWANFGATWLCAMRRAPSPCAVSAPMGDLNLSNATLFEVEQAIGLARLIAVPFDTWVTVLTQSVDGSSKGTRRSLGGRKLHDPTRQGKISFETHVRIVLLYTCRITASAVTAGPRRRDAFSVLAGVMAFPALAQTPRADVICNYSARLEQMLRTVMLAQRPALGLHGPETLLEVWIDPRTQDRTLAQIYRNGTSGIIAMGEHCEELTRAPT